MTKKPVQQAKLIDGQVIPMLVHNFERPCYIIDKEATDLLMSLLQKTPLEVIKGTIIYDIRECKSMSELLKLLTKEYAIRTTIDLWENTEELP